MSRSLYLPILILGSLFLVVPGVKASDGDTGDHATGQTAPEHPWKPRRSSWYKMLNDLPADASKKQIRKRRDEINSALIKLRDTQAPGSDAWDELDAEASMAHRIGELLVFEDRVSNIQVLRSLHNELLISLHNQHIRLTLGPDLSMGVALYLMIDGYKNWLESSLSSDQVARPSHIEDHRHFFADFLSETPNFREYFPPKFDIRRRLWFGLTVGRTQRSLVQDVRTNLNFARAGVRIGCGALVVAAAAGTAGYFLLPSLESRLGENKNNPVTAPAPPSTPEETAAELGKVLSEDLGAPPDSTQGTTTPSPGSGAPVKP